MKQIRLAQAHMRDGAQAAFVDAAGRAHRARIVRSLMYVMAGLLNLGFLGWASQKVTVEMNHVSRGKALLGTILASIGDGVIVADAAGRIVFMNTEAERLTGWKGSQAAGEQVAHIFNIVDERTRQQGENPVDAALRSGSVAGLTPGTLLLRRDGTELPIDNSAAPIREPNGTLFGVVLVFRDFTTQKQVEEKLEQTVAERTAKLREMVAELEHVSYAIVHDMRAPLRAMQAFAYLLEEEAIEERPSDRLEYARRITTAASRLDRLIQDVLAYNQVVLQEVPLAPVDLSRHLQGLIETYPDLDPARADIQLQPGLPTVLGNEALLTECFANLLGNAVKFVATGTRPAVAVRAEERGDFARVWVEDNGIGIQSHFQKRLFRLFQRVNPGYEGTGLGLAIVRKAAERMGGKVGVESEPGKGSRFWVDLPLAAAQSRSLAHERTGGHPT